MIQQICSSGFFSKVHNLTTSAKLIRFPVPAMISYIFSGAHVQLDNCQLSLACECHLFYFYAYLTMLLIIMFYSYCSWIGLFNWFLLLASCMIFSGTMDSRFQERGFQVIFSSKCGVFSNSNPPSTPERQPRATSIIYIIQGINDYSDKQFKRKVSCIQYQVVFLLVYYFLWGVRWLNFLKRYINDFASYSLHIMTITVFSYYEIF